MRPKSLQKAVTRNLEGYDFINALNELLDEFYVADSSERQRMINEEPSLTGDAFQDAYVGAVGEHLARRWNLEIPSWVEDERRFLETPHFPPGLELAKPVYLRDSPSLFGDA